MVLKEKALETVNPQPLLFLVLGLGAGWGWNGEPGVRSRDWGGSLPAQPHPLLTWSRCLCLGMVRSDTLNPRGSRGLSLTLRLQHWMRGREGRQVQRPQTHPCAPRVYLGPYPLERCPLSPRRPSPPGWAQLSLTSPPPLIWIKKILALQARTTRASHWPHPSLLNPAPPPRTQENVALLSWVVPPCGSCPQPLGLQVCVYRTYLAGNILALPHP